LEAVDFDGDGWQDIYAGGMYYFGENTLGYQVFFNQKNLSCTQ